LSIGQIFSFSAFANQWAIDKNFFDLVWFNVVIKDMIDIPIIPFTVDYSQFAFPSIVFRIRL